MTGVYKAVSLGLTFIRATGFILGQVVGRKIDQSKKLDQVQKEAGKFLIDKGVDAGTDKGVDAVTPDPVGNTPTDSTDKKK